MISLGQYLDNHAKFQWECVGDPITNFGSWIPVIGDVFCFHPLFDKANPSDSHRLALIIVGAHFLVGMLYDEQH